ncbi:REP-associated tyrosine transposase [Nodosilinea sp. E11]|uniref:REP-associated tyrosine transposase n=1 Tax=Nodosilinea sp. E11 TaxID=3037479 RepID=UPI0029347847|nr:transposase [Nodosilinea sp. E11]WOD40932.1 transposase [Nodosilinea sp. E11]
MPNYRRLYRPGGSYFFTHVTYQRYPWLCTDLGRQSLRQAIIAVRRKHPFAIDAFVLLPDHFHCIWTLPEGDCDYAKRWRLIKLMVTKACGQELALPSEKTVSGERRREGNLWQRRYWEHCIRDERDFVSHCEYVHYNPVRHGLVECPTDWVFSTVHRYLWEQNE